ncbi:MAG: VOC family protein [Chloroflexota bacterium]|nr:VOC family protein [Dehalococcoidia bacterium]MDW8253789.1 VOC family protein [Chloroflexota bacterium]
MALTGPVRRANVIVRDMEASLRFYRDLLGFTVFFDDVVSAGAGGRILNVPCRAARMVVLRADEGTVGMIGLMELQDAAGLAPPIEPAAVRLGEPFLALQSDRFSELVERLEAAGVQFVNHPAEFQVQGRRVREFAVRDPDGLMINIIESTPPSPS